MEAQLAIFIDRLAATVTVEDARRLLTTGLADLGFERLAYLGLHIPDARLARPVIVSTYPAEWVGRYMDRGYAAVDPVVREGLCSVVPFTWGADAQHRTLPDEGRRMMDEAGDFGLRRGITVPIHGARGELAALTLALPDGEREAFARIEARRHLVHLMALHFHAHVGARILGEAATRGFRLSPREKECLLWAAEGKTLWETAEILGLGHHTVREYVQEACRKLGVYSKAHAVVKAIMLGLIRPG
jgi:DNA-binding CsgD family transcriptional regulator